jgi:hypothetical protein
MKFTCPVCKSTGNLPQNDLEKPITKTTCQSCAAILLVNPDSSKVEAHKSSLKDPGLEDSSLPQNDEAPSALSMHPQDRQSRDWLAVGVIIVVLIILIAAGIYFAMNVYVIQTSFLSVFENISSL